MSEQKTLSIKELQEKFNPIREKLEEQDIEYLYFLANKEERALSSRLTLNGFSDLTSSVLSDTPSAILVSFFEVAKWAKATGNTELERLVQKATGELVFATVAQEKEGGQDGNS